MSKNTGPHLWFEVGAESDGELMSVSDFALPVDSVSQVIEPEAIASVPLAPGVVQGIMTHHGRIVTIVDPAPLLGLPPQGKKVVQTVVLRLAEGKAGHLGLQVLRSRGIVPKNELVEVDVPRGPAVSWVAQKDLRLIQVIAMTELLDRLRELFGTTMFEPRRETARGM